MWATVNRLCEWSADKRGATAIEYALIAGGVSITIAAVVTTVGDTMKTMFYDKIAMMF